MVSYCEPWDRDGYLGGAISYVNTSWDNGLGSLVVPTSAPGLVAFAGYHISEHFGVEVYYQYFQSSSRNYSALRNQALLGRVVPSYQETHDAKFKMKGWGGSIILTSSELIDDFKVYMGIGCSDIASKVTHTHISTTAISGFPAAYINAKRTLTKNKRLIPELKGGFNYEIDDWVGVRGEARWLKTSKINYLSAPNVEFKAKQRDSFSLSLGLAFYI